MVTFPAQFHKIFRSATVCQCSRKKRTYRRAVCSHVRVVDTLSVCKFLIYFFSFQFDADANRAMEDTLSTIDFGSYQTSPDVSLSFVSSTTMEIEYVMDECVESNTLYESSSCYSVMDVSVVSSMDVSDDDACTDSHSVRSCHTMDVSIISSINDMDVDVCPEMELEIVAAEQFDSVMERKSCSEECDESLWDFGQKNFIIHYTSIPHADHNYCKVTAKNDVKFDTTS